MTGRPNLAILVLEAVDRDRRLAPAKRSLETAALNRGMQLEIWWRWTAGLASAIAYRNIEDAMQRRDRGQI